MRFLNILISLTLFLIFSSALHAEHRQAPDFSLNDLNGKSVKLSDFKGKVVLLNFWATWCNVCVDEMDSLNKAYRDMKGKGFVVIAVSIDQSKKPVSDFVKLKGLEFPVLLDPEKEVYFDRYAGFGLPISFLIDKKGNI
ncbi:MAG: TlpA disulfide reductase family protein, partial [Thermodesulfovibrionales bacterium]